MRIRKADKEDIRVLAELACRLWPSHTAREMQAETTEILEMPDAAYFLAYRGETAVGFAQCQLRHDYVEGTDSSPVGYLEGIYVAEEHRKGGLPKRCWQRLKAGQRAVAVQNLPAIVSWKIRKVCNSI